MTRIRRCTRVLGSILFLVAANWIRPSDSAGQELRIIGFLDLPAYLGEWGEEGWIEPDPALKIQIRDAPRAGSPVSTQPFHPLQLELAEFQYEHRGALVFGRRGGWSLVRLESGQIGWLSPEDLRDGEFHALTDILIGNLAYLTNAFDRFLAPAPGSMERMRVPDQPNRKILGVLEPRSTILHVELGPDDDPEEILIRNRGHSSSIRTRADGSRFLSLRTGTPHLLYRDPNLEAPVVDTVYTHRPHSTVVSTSRVPGQILVFDTRPGWYQVALADGDWRSAPRVWLEAGQDWPFQPAPEATDAAELFPSSFSPRLFSVDVREVQQVDDRIWARVELYSESPCRSASEPTVTQEGWIPLHDETGEVTVWFFSRGC